MQHLERFRVIGFNVKIFHDYLSVIDSFKMVALQFKYYFISSALCSTLPFLLIILDCKIRVHFFVSFELQRRRIWLLLKLTIFFR